MRGMILPVLVLLYLLLLTGDAGAAPLRPVGPVDVTGTISRIEWVPETTVRGKSGMSGSLGHDRIRPAHFLVALTDYEGVDAETALRMTRYLDWKAFKDREQAGKPPSILLMINHNNRNYLRKGMKIRVTGYTIRGDEGGTWTHYAGLYDMDRPDREDAIRSYLETHIESPGPGGRMFCSYEVFGSQKKGDREYIYLWAFCMEYSVKGNHLMKGAGASMPAALVSLLPPRSFDIIGHESPVEGEGYAESVRRIFPKQYHKAVLVGTKEHYRRAERLMRDTEKQAETYYFARF